MTADEYRALALAIHDASEHAHMNHPDFRIQGRIFATLLADDSTGGLALSPEEQQELMTLHPAAFRPASGAWGRRGWTMVDLAAADVSAVRGALVLAAERTAARGPARRARTRGSTRG